MNMKQSNAHYKNFKKFKFCYSRKTSNIAVDTAKEKERNSDRFGDLKSKLQRQKESMKKTGRRFRQEHSVSTQAISIEVGTQQSKVKVENSKSCEISIGPDAPIKQTISLCDIGITEKQSDSESLMRSSRVFEREVKHQKKRNDQLNKFLQSLGLQSFSEGLINNGYDDLQTLAEVNIQDLNHLMMRAQQQDRLIDALKKLKLREQKQQQPMTQSAVTTRSHWRIKTQATGHMIPFIQQSKRKKTETIAILQRIKTERGEKDSNENNNQLQMRQSFLYTVGSRNWGVEDQIRRACSSCFRVEKQMEKKGDCYYCSNCYKFVAQDLLTISLNTSMDRSYKQKQK